MRLHYFYNVTNGVCSLVYISAPGAVSASANTVFFYSTANTYTYPSAAGAGDDYNTYTALVGTATAASAVKVAPSVVASIAAAGLLR